MIQSTGSRPLVSIIMPFFNTAPFIVRSIQSLQEQSYQNWELFAIDDGSTDNSLATIRTVLDSRIRILSNTKNGGIGSAINLALPLVGGDYIAIMDSDDVVHSDRLELGVKYMESNPDVIITGSEEMITFHKDSEISSLVTKERVCSAYSARTDAIKRTMMLFNCPYKHPTVMIRRSLWNSLQYSEVRYAEDYEMWTRAAECGKLGNIDVPLGYYRMHPGQNTRIAGNKIELMKDHIWQPMLFRLGIETSKFELEMHSLLSLAHRALQKNETADFLNWAKRLRERFERDLQYDAPELNAILSSKIFELCRDSTRLGFAAYRLFSKWLDQTGNRFALSKKLKLLLKAILRR